MPDVKRDWLEAAKSNPAILIAGAGAALGFVVYRQRKAKGAIAGKGSLQDPYKPSAQTPAGTVDSVAKDVYGSIQPQMLALYQELYNLEKAVDFLDPSYNAQTVGLPAELRALGGTPEMYQLIAPPSTYPLAGAFMPMWRQFQSSLALNQMAGGTGGY